MIIGMRIPRNFFVSSGIGESDITIHAGSFHLALKEAGIEMCNIMQYSSILPAQATEVVKPEYITHGAVLESIAAVAHCEKGEVATAGIIYGWLFDKVTGEKFGGLVCEYSGPKSEKEAKLQLRASLHELYFNGFSDKYNLRDDCLIVRTIISNKEYGTALVVLGFVDYFIPEVIEG